MNLEGRPVARADFEELAHSRVRRGRIREELLENLHPHSAERLQVTANLRRVLRAREIRIVGGRQTPGGKRDHAREPPFLGGDRFGERELYAQDQKIRIHSRSRVVDQQI